MTLICQILFLQLPVYATPAFLRSLWLVFRIRFHRLPFLIFKKAIEEGLYLTESDLDPLYRYRLLLGNTRFSSAVSGYQRGSCKADLYPVPGSVAHLLNLQQRLKRREYDPGPHSACTASCPASGSGTPPAIFIMHAFLVFVRPAAAFYPK